MRHSVNRRTLLLLSLPLLFLLVFYFYPLTRIFLLSFSKSAGTHDAGLLATFSAGNLAKYGKVLWFTAWQAALSTILTLVLALPGAYVFAKYSFRGKRVLQSLLTVPFVLPTVVTAAAFTALLGSNGLVNQFAEQFLAQQKPLIDIDQTVFFFLLAHVFYNYALVLRIVSGYWSGIEPDLKAAAQMLGASPGAIFRKITLPLLMPAIGSASLLVFIFCFTSFGVILILGGPKYATIEVEIYRQAVHLFNLPRAAALSLIQIGVNFLFMWLHARITTNSRINFLSGGGGANCVKPSSISAQIMVWVNLAFMSVLLVAPLLALILSSISGPNGLTFTYYAALFSGDTSSLFYVPPFTAIRNSVGYAALTTVIALMLGMFASLALARQSGKLTALWDALLMLPLATSAVTLGFGFIITLNRPPLNLRDSFILVPLAHALVAFPFVLRCLLPALRRIPANLAEAGTLLGAPPLRVWWSIKLPLIKTAVIGAAVFAFSVSMGEFGASSFVARPHLPTMPVAIFRFLGQPGELNYGQAMAMSNILMLITCCGFWIIGKLEDDHLSYKLKTSRP